MPIGGETSSRDTSRLQEAALASQEDASIRDYTRAAVCVVELCAAESTVAE